MNNNIPETATNTLAQNTLTQNSTADNTSTQHTTAKDAVRKKVVLAFSGGLDTTYCAVFLQRELQCEVHAVTINTGGFTAHDVAAIQTKALALGVASFTCIDVRETYYETCIKYLIFGNVLKNGTYPLSVSAERAVQAMHIAEFAKQHHITAIAHGSTGAGNDQVRFDMIMEHSFPNVEIITPIRDASLSRAEEIQYLIDNNAPHEFAQSSYSINKGLWGTTIGGVETLTSHLPLPESAWPTAVTETEPKEISLVFKCGELVAVDNVPYTNPTFAIEALQLLAQGFGIGRDYHVGDTIIGTKGRVAFEAAAPMLIIKAHQLLEKHVLTKWQLYWKDQMSAWYAQWLHEGQMLDPVMRDIEQFFQSSQQNVSGTVHITLHPHRFVLNGITSNHDLMSSKFGSYGETNNTWSGNDVKGFTKIFGNQTSIFHQVNHDSHTPGKS